MEERRGREEKRKRSRREREKKEKEREKRKRKKLRDTGKKGKAQLEESCREPDKRKS